jgi:hypothetical protein
VAVLRDPTLAAGIGQYAVIQAENYLIASLALQCRRIARRRDTALESVRLVAGDPKPWLSAGIERTISRYPRTIDFGSSNRQNDDHSERARCNMNTDLSSTGEARD